MSDAAGRRPATAVRIGPGSRPLPPGVARRPANPATSASTATKPPTPKPTLADRERTIRAPHPDPAVLPFVFCLVPLLAAVLIAAALPPGACDFYLRPHPHSPMDWLILGLGARPVRRPDCSCAGGPCSGAAPASTSGPTAG